LVKLPVLRQISKRAWWLQYGAKTLILMMCMRDYSISGLRSLHNILVSHSRFGKSRGRTFNFLRTRWKGGERLVTWDVKNINVPRHGTLVKYAITSQAIFHLTPLTIPPGCLTSAAISLNLQQLDYL
jgi:hypothetical protein